jgi:hypothetical protein
MTTDYGDYAQAYEATMESAYPALYEAVERRETCLEYLRAYDPEIDWEQIRAKAIARIIAGLDGLADAHLAVLADVVDRFAATAETALAG